MDDNNVNGENDRYVTDKESTTVTMTLAMLLLLLLTLLFMTMAWLIIITTLRVRRGIGMVILTSLTDVVTPMWMKELSLEMTMTIVRIDFDACGDDRDGIIIHNDEDEVGARFVIVTKDFGWR